MLVARRVEKDARDKHPKGLANSSGLVGQYVTAHITFSAFAMFDENTENHMGTSGAFGMSQDGYVKDSHPGFGSYTWTIGVAMKPNDVLGFANSRPQLFGTALHDFMKRASRGLARDRKSTRLNSSHSSISYAVFCLKKKNKT